MASILIKNGRIVDGTGNPWFRGDVRVPGQRIVEMGVGLTPRGERVIDAKERIVSPGFFDMHSHSEIPLLVNGEVVIEEGDHNGVRPGKVLKSSER